MRERERGGKSEGEREGMRKGETERKGVVDGRAREREHYCTKIYACM